MTEFLQPPPTTNFSVPPPPVQQQQQLHSSPSQQSQSSPAAPHFQNYPRERHYHGGFSGKGTHFRSYNNFRGPNSMSQDDFDGKRLRKSVMRKTVDYNSSIVRELEVNKHKPYKTCVQCTHIFCSNYNISLFFRTEYGSVTIVIAALCNQKAFTFLKCYRHRATWIIRLMQ